MGGGTLGGVRRGGGSQGGKQGRVCVCVCVCVCVFGGGGCRPAESVGFVGSNTPHGQGGKISFNFVHTENVKHSWRDNFCEGMRRW
jgi:hypothetical protein